MTTIVVAGAGGVFGRAVVRALRERGQAVRAVVRRERSAEALRAVGCEVRVADALRPETLTGVCNGVDAVIAAIGAPVDPSPLVGWRPYTRVDTPANINLLREAERAGVGRFVYVSLAGGAEARHLDYAEGHERVVDALAASSIPATVLRPTGFFQAMSALVDLARRGIVPVFGDGSHQTNPIDERDLAQAAVEAAIDTRPDLTQIDLGGPEVFTRLDISRLAFEVLGRRPRFVHIAAWAGACIGHATRLINPRAGHFTLFATHVMTHPCLAPQVGSRRLREYFEAHVAGLVP